MITRKLVLIGGGDLRAKETLPIDTYCAALAKERAGDRRAVALFVGTASHDSMPYYNTFHKTYTGSLGLKTDVALSVYGEMDREKLKSKFDAADMIYISGGDTLFMLEHWKKSGLYGMILDAYNRGVVICGLSAGAIFWGEKMYTDSDDSVLYSVKDGIGMLPYGICPHYNIRKDDFLESKPEGKWLLLEDNGAAYIENGEIVGIVTSGGKGYLGCFDADNCNVDTINEIK